MVKSVNTKPVQKKNNNKKKVNFKANKNKKTAKKAAKAATPKQPLEKGVDGVIEYEELGDIDSWDWTESTGTDGFITDDAGGFLCLEEISDVEVEYEGDEKTGRVAKFKVLTFFFYFFLIEIVDLITIYYRELKRRIVKPVKRPHLLFL